MVVTAALSFLALVGASPGGGAQELEPAALSLRLPGAVYRVEGPRARWELSYAYLAQSDDGNLTGTRALSTGEMLERYPVVPVIRSVREHGVAVTFRPTPRVTLHLALPYRTVRLRQVTRLNRTFERSASGAGDLVLAADWTAVAGGVRADAGLGVSVPTGSVEVRDAGGDLLPYPLQMGSGTWDVAPSLTLSGVAGPGAWRIEAGALLRPGENPRRYRLGHVAEAAAVYAVRWRKAVTAEAGLATRTWGNHAGADPELADLTDSPLYDASLRGGRRIDVPLSLAVELPRTRWGAHSVRAEVRLPVRQDLHGPQLRREWSAAVTWTFSAGGSRPSGGPPGR